MKKYLCLLIIIPIFLCCSPDKQTTPLTDFNTLLSTKLTNFARTSEIRVFSNEQIAERFSSNSDLYLVYNIKQAASVEYKKNRTSYSVDIFEFSDMLGAFGIYARRRMPDDRYISVGTQALLGEGYIYYFKDRYFMTINSFSDDLPELQNLITLASLIDSLLPGSEILPTQIEVFPNKRLVEHSLKFWPKGFDNYAVPESCWSVDYTRNNKTCRLFYATNSTNIEYDTFVKVLQKKGRVMTHMAGVGEKSVYAITDNNGKILLGYSDNIIFGVINVTNDYWAKALCEALFENMGEKLKIKLPG